MEKGLKYVTILGIKINSTPKAELLKSIENKLTKKIQFYIVTPNPEIILKAQNDPKLTHSLNSADFSLPDGFGLKLAAKNLEIIKGRELMVDLFKLANDKKLKVYLLGGHDFVNKKALTVLSKEVPHIKSKGSSGPILNNNAVPVSEVNTSLQFEIVKDINSFRPDMLLVAFGAPKQEIWLNTHLKDLNVVGAMTVGGGLDYYSGLVKPTPVLFANLHLEWLWRLVQEPRRIGRIFNALIIFPFKLAIDNIFHSVNN